MKRLIYKFLYTSIFINYKTEMQKYQKIVCEMQIIKKTEYNFTFIEYKKKIIIFIKYAQNRIFIFIQKHMIRWDKISFTYHFFTYYLFFYDEDFNRILT